MKKKILGGIVVSVCIMLALTYGLLKMTGLDIMSCYLCAFAIFIIGSFLGADVLERFGASSETYMKVFFGSYCLILAGGLGVIIVFFYKLLTEA